MDKLKVSIITATYNSASTINECVNSVFHQSYDAIEHIIIDGVSSDNTLELINEKDKVPDIIISEPDKGIYDAMNKGIALASGDIVGILNSDDFFVDDSAISKIVNCFITHKVDSVFANINYVNAQNPDKIVRRWCSGKYVKGSFVRGWHPAHPAFYIKKSIYEKYGAFNLELKLAADFELMLRFLEKHNISNYYFDESIVNMRLGGATNGSLRNIITQNFECYKAFRMNGMRISPFYFLYRLLPKLRQFFK